MFRFKRYDLSLMMFASKVGVHRSAVVRVRIKRRIASALQLISRRGAFPFPESGREQGAKDRGPVGPSKKERALHYDPSLADVQAWFLAGAH